MSRSHLLQAGLPLSAVIMINGHLLVAAFAGLAAWLLWPSTADAWGLVFASVIFGFVAVKCVVLAVKRMVQVRERLIAVSRYVADTRPPEAAKLAETSDLDRAGML